MTGRTPAVMCAGCGRPKLLDLFCCAGGAAKGYEQAGFCVDGVDLEDFSKRYPFRFFRGDAVEFIKEHGHKYAAITGSPPCQPYTLAQRIQNNEHPELVEPTRDAMVAAGKPWIIENVVGAPLIDPVLLCGSMFPGLRVYRHRLFESNIALQAPPHPEHVAKLTKMGRAPRPGEFMHVVGNFSGVAQAREAMGISWMVRDELREAIPPAFTKYLGRFLMEAVVDLLR